MNKYFFKDIFKRSLIGLPIIVLLAIIISDTFLVFFFSTYIIHRIIAEPFQEISYYKSLKSKTHGYHKSAIPKGIITFSYLFSILVIIAFGKSIMLEFLYCVLSITIALTIIGAWINLNFIDYNHITKRVCKNDK